MARGTCPRRSLQEGSVEPSPAGVSGVQGGTGGRAGHPRGKGAGVVRQGPIRQEERGLPASWAAPRCSWVLSAARRAAGEGQGAHRWSLSGSPRGCGGDIDSIGCTSTLEQSPPAPRQRPETDVGARGGTPRKKSLRRPRRASRVPRGAADSGRGVDVAERGRRNPERWGQDTCVTRVDLKTRGQVAGGHLREGQHGSCNGSHCVRLEPQGVPSLGRSVVADGIKRS